MPVNNPRRDIRTMPAAEADLVRAFLAQRGATRPNPDQQKRAAHQVARQRKLIDEAKVATLRYRLIQSPDSARYLSQAVADGATSIGKRGMYLDGPSLDEKAPVRVPVALSSLPPLPPISTPGHCDHCAEPLPARHRPGTRFCSNACKSADRRSRIVAGLVRTKSDSALEEYGFAAFHLTDSARLGDLKADFIGTSIGVVAISDAPLPPFTVHDAACRPPLLSIGISISEHRSSDPRIRAAVKAAKRREVGLSRNEPPSQAYIAKLDAFLSAPDRAVTLIAFDPDTSGTEHMVRRTLLCRFGDTPN
jgi:hypothetical protein